ncbi:MAG: HD domain-containing protein [Actinobacteria bacterium]|nr:HD domain-containing protein [Actinomycetota bacterium]
MTREASSRFTAYCIGIFVAALALCVGFYLGGQRPPIDQVLILGLLFAVAENRSVELPNKSSLSASLMIAMTAIVLFSAPAPNLGPLVVGLCGGLYLPQLRSRDWRKVLFNSANFGLSSLAASALFELIVPTAPAPAFLLAASIPVALLYSLANSALLVPAMSMLTHRSLADVSQEMWVSDIQILPFGFLGVLLGELYLNLDGWVVPLFVAPIFIARQAFASYLQLRAAQEATLSTLVRALESKDRYTAGHVERVARFSQYMGQELGFRQSRLERLRYAALMHDIGKLIVPNQILNKPGKLTAAEYDRMRHHEFVSVEVLRRIDFLAPVVPSIEADHSGGSDPNSSLEARIILVADAFDAMTSTRAYRRALTQEVAFAELRDKAGSQFDAECVDALVRSIEAKREIYGAGFEGDVADFKAPPPTTGTGSAGLGDLAQDSERVS